MAIVTPTRLEALDEVIESVIEAAAPQVDETGDFPRSPITALGEAGLLGLVSEADVGGGAEGVGSVAVAVERVARSCASTAMVLCMHYAATAVLEHAGGSREVRQAIAEGRHVTTLALRGGLPKPLLGATQLGNRRRRRRGPQRTQELGYLRRTGRLLRVVEHAAGGTRPSTLWLVPRERRVSRTSAPFNGLGMRGNSSRSRQSTSRFL